MRRKLISFCLILWIFSMMPMRALAQEFDANRVGSISVTLMDQGSKTPISGAELSLYYVATVGLNSENNLSYIYTEAFQDCGCALDDPALLAVLDTFVKEHSVSAQKLVTDADGNVTFTDLPLGLYFVRQTNIVTGYAPCTPFLVTVPHYDDAGYEYNVNASPKTDVARLTSITIQKVWNTDASASPTDSVTIQLLKDGVVVETAILSAENHWQVTYTDLPESDAYSILEVNVPKGFTVTYSQNGYVFTATNTASLIQTGQLIWPIPILAMTGFFLIAVGAAVLRKTRDKNA